MSTNIPTRPACAACKYFRRKCAPDCILAPYFPHNRGQQFLNAHKLFGVGNMTKIIRGIVDPGKKDDAMRAIIYESDARARDPVGGCCRAIRVLQRQIESNEAELVRVIQHQIEYMENGLVVLELQRQQLQLPFEFKDVEIVHGFQRQIEYKKAELASVLQQQAISRAQIAAAIAQQSEITTLASWR